MEGKYDPDPAFRGSNSLFLSTSSIPAQQYSMGESLQGCLSPLDKSHTLQQPMSPGRTTLYPCCSSDFGAPTLTQLQLLSSFLAPGHAQPPPSLGGLPFALLIAVPAAHTSPPSGLYSPITLSVRCSLTTLPKTDPTPNTPYALLFPVALYLTYHILYILNVLLSVSLR